MDIGGLEMQFNFDEETLERSRRLTENIEEMTWV